ncbi:ComF family protein [Mesorhizobium sp. J18]|uniref:ComF family protein n=1 Tax=Mesorhizobium sp. J18 TaxID=935263 RepID=UPI0011996C56|nr:ComF family protein [Mesorhizobium sp. J18]TWG90278.1 ComF family protein [Mesorhizobium sp. J18]
MRSGIWKDYATACLQWPGTILFPPVCLACHDHVVRPGTLCAGCWPAMRFLEKPWCEVMGTPFGHDMGEGFLSAEAIANPPPFARARAAVGYTGPARRMVQQLKFHDRTDLAPWMARWMLRAAGELIPDADLVVPIPLHRGRFLRRRFNQSAELARAFARLAGLPFDPVAVERIKGTRRQVGLGARERQDNVRGAFRVRPEKEIAVAGRRVVLVDDVYTTGATVSSVTRALKRAGARNVDVLTFARVLPGDFRPEDADTI